MATTATASDRQRKLAVITVNGVRIAYTDTGGTGIPLVLVHGSWGSHHNWDQVVSGLAERFRVVTYDRHRHNDSERPSGQGHFSEEGSPEAAAWKAQENGALAEVARRIEADDLAGAAETFVDQVALGPGSWAAMSAAMRATMTGNAADLSRRAQRPGVEVDRPGAARRVRRPGADHRGRPEPANL